MKLRSVLATACVAGGIALSGCVDLEVVAENPNAPDAARALRTASDIEALIAGGWGNWWNSTSANTGVGPILATASYMHSATAANFGMVEFSSWPKVAVHHQTSNVFYNEFANNFIWLYRSISAARDGMAAIDGGVALPAAQAARAKAYGYFVLGLAHGSASILFDKAYVYDPSIAMEDVVLAPYQEVNAAAMNYFDQALASATGMAAIPATWMSKAVDEATFRQLVHSYKARYRAAVARTPAERAAVNWAAVRTDVANGITADWGVNVHTSSGFSSGSLVNMPRYGAWGQLSYQILGMADQSGAYQIWIARDPWDRHPNLASDQVGDPFLIQTPDTRFPTGATIVAQQGADGTLFEIAQASQSGGYTAQWARPDRGTFRWSYYRYKANDQWLLNAADRTEHNEITVNEMRLLDAEALYRQGSFGAAADLINVTRVAAGLNATDAAGLNTSCVPRLRDGSCGDLFEMLKWEKRLETMYQGLHMASWYFDGRGWGELSLGTFLQLPVPGLEMELIATEGPPYTFGGPGGDGSAPIGVYGF